jgi:multicomponent Na+:H+ antiporter subunit F
VNADDLILLAADVTLVALSVALLMVAWRILAGPTLPDRIVALDLLVGIVIGFIATLTIRTGYSSYLDVAIALGLVGFLATVALARFVLSRGQSGDAPTTLPSTDDPRSGRTP